MGDVCLLDSYVLKQYKPNECSFPSVVFSLLRIKIKQPSCRRFSSSKICWISCIDSELNEAGSEKKFEHKAHDVVRRCTTVSVLRMFVQPGRPLR